MAKISPCFLLIFLAILGCLQIVQGDEGVYGGSGGEYGGSGKLERRVNKIERELKGIKRELKELFVQIKLLIKLKIKLRLIIKLKKRMEAIEEAMEAYGPQIISLTRRVDDCCPAATFHGIPGSCQDIYDLGNRQSGFYTIQVNGELKIVFCNFRFACEDHHTSKIIEINVGVVITIQIKIFIHIKLVLKIDLVVNNNPIPLVFNTVVANQPAGAYNPQTGVITAPVDGLYLILCAFVKAYASVDAVINILVDGVIQATTTGFTGVGSTLTLWVNALVKLKIHANVTVVLSAGALAAGGDHFCQITTVDQTYDPVHLSGKPHYHLN